MSSLPDPIVDGLARGWKVFGAWRAAPPATLDCDLANVGSGAGAGVTAELLTAVGLDVVLVEEGPLRSGCDFKQLEALAYTTRHQECASRMTADKAVSILQIRCVGGSTTVNWTGSFPTPSALLADWRERFALPELTDEALSPWIPQAERRLSIGPWLVPPNADNDKLSLGAARLAIPAAASLRNVKTCWNLGSCALGCPTNAKCSADALRSARPTWAAGSAHLPAPGVGLGGGVRRAHRRLGGRATDPLQRPLPGPAPHRRAHGLQARGPATAAGDRGHHAAGLRGPANRSAARRAQQPRPAGPDARRLSRAVAGWAGQAQGRRRAGAGLPLDRLRDGRRPPRDAEHGRDPVRCRCGAGLAGARDGASKPQLGGLRIHDGSLFPTSIGANPQLSVYGLSTLLASALARRLSGRELRLLHAAAA